MVLITVKMLFHLNCFLANEWLMHACLNVQHMQNGTASYQLCTRLYSSSLVLPTAVCEHWALKAGVFAHFIPRVAKTKWDNL